MRQHRFVALAGLTAVAFALSGFTAPTSLVFDPSAVSAKARPHCLGKVATIVGTKAAETIHGTAGDDVIVGRGGNDHIYGMGGADRICDRAGDFSRLYGGLGADRIAGGFVIAGGAGDDVLLAPRIALIHMHGGKGDDLMRSRATTIASFDPGPGDDTIESRPGSLTSIADFRAAPHGVVVDLHKGTADGDGHDVLHGINYVYGSKHDDVLLGDAHSNQIGGNGGDDVIAGRGGHDFVDGGPGDDRVGGGADPDFVVGDAGRDTLRGGGGNDSLAEQKPEANLIVGGPGRRDRCYGGYKVPPNVERGCELHKPAPGRQRRPALVMPSMRRGDLPSTTSAGRSAPGRRSCHIQPETQEMTQSSA
jgi:Ca2+-binding RTX toxin-like protein